MEIKTSKLTSWQEKDKTYCWHPFTQAKISQPPLVITHAKDSYLFDENNQGYLDMISSWWVNLHGHAHPTIANAVAKQAHALEHVMFAGITHPPAIKLAEKLASLLPSNLQFTFFTDNGSTAVEVALKMACQYWINQNQKRTRFLAFEGAYHGDTFGAMATGKSSGFYTPFLPWLFEVDFIDYPATWYEDNPIEKENIALNKLDAYLTTYSHETIAFIAEPLMQGASGMRLCRPEFLNQIMQKLKAHHIPIIFDEVMTGFGRTGTLFACQQLQFEPDIICLSKGLTGGFLPMGATVTSKEIYQAFLSDDVNKALLHGHSYTANPLGCAAALASLEIFEDENTPTKIQKITESHKKYQPILSKHPAVKHWRQLGTIIAFELNGTEQHYGSSAGQWFRNYLLSKHIILRPLGNTIYLLPPYCTKEDELNHVYQALLNGLDIWWKDQTNITQHDMF